MLPGARLLSHCSVVWGSAWVRFHGGGKRAAWCKEEPTVVVTERSLPARERRSLLAGLGLAVLLLSPEVGVDGKRRECNF